MILLNFAIPWWGQLLSMKTDISTSSILRPVIANEATSI